MPTNTKKSDSPVGMRPEIHCSALPKFDVEDLSSVRRAFQQASPCPLRQAWQNGPSPGFAPAEVRVGWQEDCLLVFSELTDRDIHTSATALNQRLWELGDAFEIFLRAEGQNAYVEFQVAPNNQRLQLRYADRAALDRARDTGNLTEALIPGEAFRSRTWIDVQLSRWNVFAEMPAAVVIGSSAPLIGTRWHFSFSRYDYTRGAKEPVISSTSLHAKADFHRQQDWGVMQFKPQQ
jgi:hypothetical protein